MLLNRNPINYGQRRKTILIENVGRKNMRTLIITGILFAMLLNACNSSEQTNYLSEREYILVYNKPADATAADDKSGWRDDKHWLNALPLGNGSLGIMVFGDVNQERLQLNEEKHVVGKSRRWRQS